jgi:hypothetical protein
MMGFVAMTTPVIALTVNNLELFYSSLIKSAWPFVAIGESSGSVLATVEAGTHEPVPEGSGGYQHQWFHYRSLESRH